MKIPTLTLVTALTTLCGMSSKAETVYLLTADDQILTFDSATPGTIISARSITGLQTGETLRGLDARPATGTLYSLGSSSRLYTINPNTGAATQVGSQFSTLLNGTSFAFDFNPAVDRIRVASDLNQNLRVNPNDAGVTVDGNFAYAPGDTYFSQNPNINGVAYDNNFSGALTTTLYAIDSLQNTLSIVTSPNAGTLSSIGLLGIDASRFNGFDISGASGVAYAVTPAASSDPGANLYTIDLGTGAATLIGRIGTFDQDTLVRGMTVMAIPEPGVTALLAVGGCFGSLVLWRRRRS